VAAEAGAVAVGADSKHRVGIGWRPELAAGIFAHLDRIDMVEVVADNYFNAPRREIDALRGLAEQVPVHLHGVGLGLASSSPVDTARLDRIARLIERVRPASWSEHLAFVRSDGIEIGHLAMPPRTDRSLEQTVRNVEFARTVTGVTPALENIATLFDPPMSTFTESEWTREIVRESGAPMLLDLHNLYANAVNAGRDAFAEPSARYTSRAVYGSSTSAAQGGCSTIIFTRPRGSCSNCWPRLPVAPRPRSTWCSSGTATTRPLRYC
jgi:uncharacterized protein